MDTSKAHKHVWEDILMKLTITDPQKFGKDIHAASQFAKSDSLPILGGLNITAKPKEIYLTATDLENAISIQTAGIDVHESGNSVIDAKIAKRLFGDTCSIQSNWVKGLGLKTQERIELETEGNFIKIAAGAFRAKIVTIDGDDFPKLPEFTDRTPDLVIPYKKLASLKKLLSLTGDDRFDSIQIGFRKSNKLLNIVASNGREIGLYTFVKNYTGNDFAILPSTLKQAAKASNGIRADWEIFLGEVNTEYDTQRIHIRIGDMIISSSTAEVLPELIDKSIENAESKYQTHIQTKRLKSASDRTAKTYREINRRERLSAVAWFSFEDMENIRIISGKKKYKEVEENRFQPDGFKVESTEDIGKIRHKNVIPNTIKVSDKYLDVIKNGLTGNRNHSVRIGYKPAGEKHILSVDTGSGMHFTTIAKELDEEHN